MSMWKHVASAMDISRLPNFLPVTDVDILFKFRLGTITSVHILFNEYRLQRREAKYNSSSEKAVHNCQTNLGYQTKDIVLAMNDEVPRPTGNGELGIPIRLAGLTSKAPVVSDNPSLNLLDLDSDTATGPGVHPRSAGLSRVVERLAKERSSRSSPLSLQAGPAYGLKLSLL